MSVDPPDASKRLKDRLESNFTFLSDPDAELLDELGIRHVGAHEGRDIAYPTAILVDASGVIRWTFESSSLRERPDPRLVIEAIGGLG